MNKETPTQSNDDIQDLITRVEAFNPEAAELLRNPSRITDDFYPSNVLMECFIWDNSKQDRYYWNEIARELGEL